MPADEKKILQVFKRDLANSETNKKGWDEQILKWSEEFNGDPYGNEVKGKASVVSRDIKKTALWQHASVIDPFVTGDDIVDCSPVTASDKETSDQAQLLLNYQMCRDFNRYNFMSGAFKILQREGTVVARVSWEFLEEEQDVEVPTMGFRPVQDPMQAQQMQAQGIPPYEQVQVGTHYEKQMVTIENRPRVELVRNSMLWIDPTAENSIEDAQFVIYKYKSSLSKLRLDGRYKNLDNIIIDGVVIWDEATPYIKDETFTFEDKPRQEIEVVEYWGNYDMNGDGIAEAVICTWVGDTIIRMEENPYPDGKHPFVSCAYDSDPFSIYGLSQGDTISTDQKIKTGIKRAVIDTLDSSTNGQKAVRKGSLDIANQRKFNKGENFEYLNQTNEIWEGKFNAIPSDVLNFYNIVDQDIQSLSGVRPFGDSSGSSSLGNTNPNMGSGLDAAARRETDISRNFKENFLVPILRKWYSMDAEWMEEDQIIRVTDEEFIAIKADDLQGRIDITMNVNTKEVENEKSNNLSFMLQTMAQSLPPALTQMLLAEQAKLKGMPALSKQIAEYQPQPDPFEEEMKQLEIEKLKSEIAERYSRIGKNEADGAFAGAKGQSEGAKARKAHSDADMVDLDFLRKQSGQDFDENMANEDAKSQRGNRTSAYGEAMKYLSQSALNEQEPDPVKG